MEHAVMAMNGLRTSTAGEQVSVEMVEVGSSQARKVPPADKRSAAGGRRSDTR
jgi:hypothetical protein